MPQPDFAPFTRDILYVTGAGYQTTYELASPGTSLTGTTPAFGSWAQMDWAIVNKDVFIVGATIWLQDTSNDISWYQYEIGLGPNGSEVPVWQWKDAGQDHMTAAGTYRYTTTFWPRFLPVKAGGTQLSIRSASSVTSMTSSCVLTFVNQEDVRLLP
jgi:hypothetical protein